MGTNEAEGNSHMNEIGFVILTQCQKCGKTGDSHDIPTLTFPDGSERTLCDSCFKEEVSER